MIGCLTETTTCVVAKPLVVHYVTMANDNQKIIIRFNTKIALVGEDIVPLP